MTLIGTPTREIWDHQTKLLELGGHEGEAQALGAELMLRTDRSAAACRRDRRLQAERTLMIRSADLSAFDPDKRRGGAGESW